MRPVWRRWLIGAGSVTLAWCAGCSEELGPEPMCTATVTGRLLLGGRSVGRGWVEFQPVDGAVGHLRGAPLGADGTFRVERVAVGPVAIRPVLPDPVRTGDPRLDPALSQLERVFAIRRTIPPGAEAPPLEIDLAAEARRALAGR